ncbi:conserved hypothetical protein [Vibrio aestuarianus]|nr:conserved hypothetical protein [Vibrio aestuarianus]
MSHATTTLDLNALNTELDPDQKCQAWGIPLKLFVMFVHRVSPEFIAATIKFNVIAVAIGK